MEATTLKFEAWQSAVDPGFWAELARRKLDTIGLSEDPVRVEALYAPASNAKVSSPRSSTAAPSRTTTAPTRRSPRRATRSPAAARACPARCTT